MAEKKEIKELEEKGKEVVEKIVKETKPVVEEAKKKADFVLVIVHGGSEHFQLPTPRMQATYRFFVDAGADAVVNHHQHC